MSLGVRRLQRYRSVPRAAVVATLLPLLAPAAFGAGRGPEDEPAEVPAISAEMVVTASRVEEELTQAPVAVSLVTAETLAAHPADNYGDALRRVPGVNAIQISARDVNLTPRSATGRNARSTLALVDGRTIYLDYFGQVLWDLVAVDMDDVDRVEVIRGPASAMWGANALNGVVNIITKSPWDSDRLRLRLRAGELGTYEGSATVTGADDRFGYRLSASYFTQDAWERPLRLEDGSELPPYPNQGTEQIHLSGRAEFRPNDTETIRFDGGFSDSGGILLTGLGPFDSTTLRDGYGSAQYDRGSLNLRAFVNLHDSSYESLLGGDGVDATTQTYHVEANDRRLIGNRHVLVYGASARAIHFDVSLVPTESGRQEAGAFIEGDFALTDTLRLRLGGRADWFNTFGANLSPRASLAWQACAGHNLRASYNRAYNAPSVVENYLRFSSAAAAPLPTGPFVFPIEADGNEDLEVETIDAFELGYSGQLSSRVVATISAYHNIRKGLINFVPVAYYTADAPPPGWPLPNEALNQIPLPRQFSYRNVGRVLDQGVELGLEARLAAGIRGYASYSWQDEPEVTQGTSPIVINRPPRHRANAGLSFEKNRLFGSLSVAVADRAYFADVPPFVGWTDAYAMLNAAAGVALAKPGVRLTLNVTNLTNEPIRQHVFGDVLRRRAVAELRFVM